MVQCCPASSFTRENASFRLANHRLVTNAGVRCENYVNKTLVVCRTAHGLFKKIEIITKILGILLAVIQQIGRLRLSINNTVLLVVQHLNYRRVFEEKIRTPVIGQKKCVGTMRRQL